MGFWFSGSSAHFPFGRLLSVSCCSLATVEGLWGDIWRKLVAGNCRTKPAEVLT